ncbi:hypothetical protein NBRC10512_004309 [Rhodotorula toruloides]|uniref:L-pipecolate oxidase n=1 Tax=Rhodotorula toruloides (strain NP11) TaxID=1130832 RepID=M7WYY7_RHOT1|nr:L-pipecolate oxidase [Rhodotorula toruloides NP11]EMS23276.1 L-pipecolate oxidase [Rhodotorula toruloides NP11]
MACPAPPATVLIVGGGEFGSTTALALAEGPYRGHGNLITVLERGAEPPAVDAASSDYNKIVRADYADPLYQSFAIEAIKQWRTPRWKKHFHECGVVVAAAETDPQAGYVVNSHKLNTEEDVGRLERAEGIKRFYPASIGTGEFPGDVAYKNKVGGWAASRDAVVEAIDLSRKLGVTFVSGEAESLIICPGPNGSDVKGAQTVDGREYRADFVIVACGSWTPKLLPELATNCLPTGQTVATVQLSKEEMEKHKDMPVSLFMDTGFYCFPPNKDGIVKMGAHPRSRLARSLRHLPLSPTDHPLVRLREAAVSFRCARRIATRDAACASRVGREGDRRDETVLVLGPRVGRLPVRLAPDVSLALCRRWRKRPRLQVPSPHRQLDCLSSHAHPSATPPTPLVFHRRQEPARQESRRRTDREEGLGYRCREGDEGT